MLASLERDGWQLESGVERHREAPDTFSIPEERVRKRLVPESHAKLIFTLRRSGGNEVVERMWVRITGYTDDTYEGVLDNKPKTPDVPLQRGDRIEFLPDHIIDALPPENRNPNTRQYQ